MSQYDSGFDYRGKEFSIMYGHDHAIGYFVSIWADNFHNEEDEPAIKIDEMKPPIGGLRHADYWDKIPACYQDVMQSELNTLFQKMKSGEKSVEKMVRDNSHLGHRLAGIMAKGLDQDLPESTK